MSMKTQQDFVKTAPHEVTVKVANLRYFNEFWTLKCKRDLMDLEIFPNPKEITESFSAYNAVRTHLKQFSFSDPDIAAVCVGDGRSPRTGATFAFRSAWQVFSVDPLLTPEKWEDKIDRLVMVPTKIEEMPFKIRADRVVVLAVHSHAGLNESLKMIEAKEIAVVAIPCCKDLFVGEPSKRVYPDHQYRDWGNWSPENTVKVWSNVLYEPPGYQLVRDLEKEGYLA